MRTNRTFSRITHVAEFHRHFEVVELSPDLRTSVTNLRTRCTQRMSSIEQGYSNAAKLP
jgi:hypothetical protein